MVTFEFHATSLTLNMILSWKLVVHWKSRHMCRWLSGKLEHGPSSIVIRGRFFASQAVCPMYKRRFSCENLSFSAEEIPDHRGWACSCRPASWENGLVSIEIQKNSSGKLSTSDALPFGVSRPTTLKRSLKSHQEI
jgi:hypothetical protein